MSFQQWGGGGGGVDVGGEGRPFLDPTSSGHIYNRKDKGVGFGEGRGGGGWVNLGWGSSA